MQVKENSCAYFRFFGFFFIFNGRVMPLINRLCGVDLTFVQGRVGRVEVHQAADVGLVAEIGRRLVLPGLRGGVCGGGSPNRADLTRGGKSTHVLY